MTVLGFAPRRIWRIALAVFVAMATIQPASAQTRNRKLDRILQEEAARGRGTRVRVIVRMDPSRRADVARALDAIGRGRREHRLISGFSLEVPADALNGLANVPGVESISIDAPLSASAVPATNGELLRQELGVPSTGGYQGAGVGVAVIDSGIAPLATFGNRIRAFYDFTRGGVTTTPRDDYGHGTHVAATIGGSGAPYGNAYSGVAPSVSLVGLKVLDANGQGYASDVIDAIEFAIANKTALDIDVINLSLGHAPYESATTDPLVRAVEQASAAGIVVVVSAGNVGINPATGLPGYGGITSPGNARSAITVGASQTMGTVGRSDDLIGPFSSRGPTWNDRYAKPDLVAPGHKIVQTVGTGSNLNTQNPTLRVGSGTSVSQPISLTGTSMAAAVTSGVVSRMIEAAGTKKLTPNLAKAILQYTATTLKDAQQVPYDRMTQGAGEINSHGAITLMKATNLSAPLNQYWRTSLVVPSTIYAGLVVPWAQNVIWGDNIVWGDSLSYHLHAYDNVVWGDNLVWGENLVWGDNVVWGDNLVWGDNVVWGENIVWSVNIVWGENLVWGENIVWSVNVVWGESDISLSEGGGEPIAGSSANLFTEP